LLVAAKGSGRAEVVSDPEALAYYRRLNNLKGVV